MALPSPCCSRAAPFRSELVDIHKQAGVTVLAPAVLRLGRRVVAVAPALLVAIARHERSLAWAVHLALYALMFAHFAVERRGFKPLVIVA